MTHSRRMLLVAAHYGGRARSMGLRHTARAHAQVKEFKFKRALA